MKRGNWKTRKARSRDIARCSGKSKRFHGDATVRIDTGLQGGVMNFIRRLIGLRKGR